MICWTWKTDDGTFHIEESGQNRNDLSFERFAIGSFPTPEEAAERCGEGDHARISDSFDGASLKVPCSLADWTRSDSNGGEPSSSPVGVLAELKTLHQRLTGRLLGQKPR